VIPALPADYFGGKAAGATLGFITVMAGIGVALGPYLGGYLFDATGSYHYLIIVSIAATALAMVSALLIRRIGKGPRDPNCRKLQLR